MLMRRLAFVVMVLALLGLLSGCKKQRPPLPPAQATAPTISDPQPIPPLTPEPEPPKPEPAPPANVTLQPDPSPKVVPRKKLVKRLPPKPEAPKPEAPKPEAPKPEAPKPPEVASPKPEPSGQLSAGLSPAKANEQRQNAAQLLAAADNNLRGLTRSLSSDEQSMVQQIRAFMTQSRAAETDGDTERAYNLALKANLLALELIKR